MGLQDKKIQVEVMGFVRTEIIDSRSTFSFSADADKWFALPDEAKEQRAKKRDVKSFEVVNQSRRVL